MIKLQGVHIQKSDSLSNRFQLVLNLIKGGDLWLQWAIKASDQNRYEVTDEEQLLRLIQQGLHSEEYIYFQTFRASIKAFLEMSDDSLEKLGQAYKQVQDEGKDLAPILSRYQLLSYEQLATVKTYLEEKELHAHPLFKAISFEDQIILYPFLDHMTKVMGELQGEAIDFGLQMAASVNEFTHFCQFYLITVQNHIPKNTAPALRMKEVKDIYQQLFPLTNFLIEVPNVGAEVSNHRLREVVPDLLREIKFHWL